jgi:hypothetical protein
MFECLEFGNSSNPAHDVKDLLVALLRSQAAAVTMITTPGPKMIWQFGELGYDISIDVPCRTCNKPILWSYWLNTYRKQLYEVYKATLNLRTSSPVFSDGTCSFSLTSNVKKIVYEHPDMDLLMLSNFSVNNSNIFGGFTQTGWWYEFYTGDSVNVSDVNMQLNLSPAEYRIYTTSRLSQPNITSTTGISEEVEMHSLTLYPNPTQENITIRVPESLRKQSFAGKIIDALGKTVFSFAVNDCNEEISLLVSTLPTGKYAVILESSTQNQLIGEEFIINR